MLNKNDCKQMLAKSKYFVAEIKIWRAAILSLLASIVFAIISWSLRGGFSGGVFLDAFSGFILPFVLVTFFLDIWPLHQKIVNGDYGIGIAFFDFVENLVYDLSNKKEEERKKNILETIYYLQTCNSRTGKTLQFNPDNPAIIQLHKTKGLIAITEARPSEWLNPTYNFYLVTNYVASVSQSIIKNAPVQSMLFSENRSHHVFARFEEDKKNILKKLSELGRGKQYNIMNFLEEHKIFIRFYVLRDEEVEGNKSIIESLIAGHDLFGCYLYFINNKIYEMLNEYDLSKFNLFLNKIGYSRNENKEKIDLAVACNENSLEVMYRKNDNLDIRRIDDENLLEFQSFIVALSSMLYSNYENEHFLYNAYFTKKSFTMNRDYCHIYYN